MFTLTAPLLHTLMPVCRQPDVWVAALNDAMPAYGVDTQQRAVYFLANLAHESRELNVLREDMNYSVGGLLRTWPKRFTIESAAQYAAMGPAAIASHVYADRLGNGNEASGDGWKYRGGGPNGLTFHNNYVACSKAITGAEDVLEDNPELIVDPAFGAAAAAWYADTSGCNKYADGGDFDGYCDVLNIGHKTITMGDSNGYASRADYLRRMQLALQ